MKIAGLAAQYKQHPGRLEAMIHGPSDELGWGLPDIAHAAVAMSANSIQRQLSSENIIDRLTVRIPLERALGERGEIKYEEGTEEFGRAMSSQVIQKLILARQTGSLTAHAGGQTPEDPSKRNTIIPKPEKWRK